jgi:glycosyltransferase involved in cell wall biosynthesis
MRILMVLEGSFPPDVRVENEISALLDAGHSITLLCTTRTDQPHFESSERLIIKRRDLPAVMYKLRAYALSVPWYHWWWKRYIATELRFEQYDAIHVHDLPLAALGHYFAQMHEMKFIADWHENLPEIMKMYRHVQRFPGSVFIKIRDWKRYEKQWARAADRLIVVTQEAQQYYEGHYIAPEGNVRVVPNYVDVAAIDAITPNRHFSKRFADRFVVVYVGDTGLRRGMMTLLKAAEHLPGIHFVLVGNSKEQRIIKAYVKEHGMRNVELTGWVSYSVAMQYVKAASIGVCPLQRNVHHDTTYANKIFQYMACGKAQIVSDCPAQARVIQQAECGLVFTADDVDALVKRIRKLKNDELRKAMEAHGRKAVEELYNWQKAAQALTRVYNELT